MRKEIGWAIFFGLILGLIVTFGIIQINRSVSKNLPNKTPKPDAQNSNQNVNKEIALSKPENLDLFTTSTVKVEGITAKNTHVVISNSESDTLVLSDASGVFTQDVQLEGGINNLVISKVTETEVKSQEITLVYSQSFEESSINENNEASETSEIREKIQKKINDLLTKPKAFIGIVTDISTDSLQIKNQDDQIKQIAINPENVSVVKNENGKSKVVKYADIAIGDTILAMGYQSSEIELDAQRILVSPENLKPELTIKYLTFSEIPTKDITRTTVVKNAKIKDITADRKVIAIYATENGKSSLRTLLAVDAEVR